MGGGGGRGESTFVPCKNGWLRVLSSHESAGLNVHRDIIVLLTVAVSAVARGWPVGGGRKGAIFIFWAGFGRKVVVEALGGQGV